MGRDIHAILEQASLNVKLRVKDARSYYRKDLATITAIGSLFPAK